MTKVCGFFSTLGGARIAVISKNRFKPVFVGSLGFIFSGTWTTVEVG